VRECTHNNLSIKTNKTNCNSCKSSYSKSIHDRDRPPQHINSNKIYCISFRNIRLVNTVTKIVEAT